MTAFYWIFLICTISWREITKRNTVQEKLHRLGPLALALQWYVIFFVGYAIMLCWSVYEMGYYLSISEGDITRHLNHRWAEEFGDMDSLDLAYMSEDQFKTTLKVRPWLRSLSWIAVVSGVVVFCLIAGQIGNYAHKCSKRSPDEHEAAAGDFTGGVWKVPTRMNMVMLIIVNPGVFSVTSLRALCRVWALVTGTATNKHHLRWPEEQSFEFALFMGDMELASAFQYFAVHVFARLCGDYLCDSSVLKAYCAGAGDQDKQTFRQHKREYQRLVRWAAFLAVHAFCVIGILRCAVDFIVCEFRIMTSYALALESVQTAVSAKLDLVFLVFTILCVINMKLVCDMKDITRKLAKASLMFLGTRILLLISDNQALVVNAFTVESSMYAKVLKMRGELSFSDSLPDWNFHSHQAHLFHLSLVSVEVLICVLFNIFAWKGLDFDASGIMRNSEERGLEEEEDTDEDQEQQLSPEAGLQKGLLLKSERDSSEAPLEDREATAWSSTKMER